MPGEGGREVDDPAAVSQPGDGLLGHEERAFDIDGDKFVEDLLGRGFHRAFPADPRVVHQDVELVASPAFVQFGVEGLEELANPCHGADIALHGKGFAAPASISRTTVAAASAFFW